MTSRGDPTITAHHDHISHTRTGSTRHEPDNNDRPESRTNPGDVDREATHAATLLEGETVPSPLKTH